MSDTDRFGTEVATSKEEIEGTWSIDGVTYDLLTEDTTKGTLGLIEEYMALAQDAESGEVGEAELEKRAEELEDFPWEEEGDDEKDVIESVIDAKLIKPKVDVQETPVRKLRALFQGMMETWSEGKTVAEARDEMPLDESGNQ